MTITDFLRSRCLRHVLTDPVGHATETLAELRATQWCDQFIEFMRTRLIVGRFRYGRLDRQRPEQYDNVGSAMQRLRAYQKDHNLEHLADVANLAMCEFVHPSHPDAHWDPIDEHGEHVSTITKDESG